MTQPHPFNSGERQMHRKTPLFEYESFTVSRAKCKEVKDLLRKKDR